MTRLAQKGWVCMRVSYRLSPIATFPDHLVDIKRAIGWARQNAHRWGGDPDRFLGLHGNSAGAHLASLAALSGGNPKYQPGFEEVDTSIDACAPVYGPTDLLNRSGAWGPEFGWVLRFLILKASRIQNPEVWREASPIDQVAPGAPPFFVVHGECDTLVPVSEGRQFVEAMRKAGNLCDYAELPGGQHALDLFHSRRGVVAADGLARWFMHRLSLRDDARGQTQAASPT
jgi:acetyl esterase/lipase